LLWYETLLPLTYTVDALHAGLQATAALADEAM
jgi:hypothetical protein